VTPQGRKNALAIAASIAASLALFACGGDREASGVTPVEEQQPAAAASAPKAPAAPPAAAAPAARAASSWETSTASFPVPEESAEGKTDEISFGSEGVDEEAGSRVTASLGSLPGGGHVFTNKDLQRYRPMVSAFGLDDERPASADDNAAANPADANKPAGEKLSPEDIQAQIDSTQAEIAKAEEDLKYLKSRKPSIHNPLLPRVPLTEDDTAKENGMDNVQRLEAIAGRIAETEMRLNELRQKLDTLNKTPPSNQ